MRDGGDEGFRCANRVLAITTPIFVPAILAIMLIWGAGGETVVHVLGLAYFFSSLAILIVLLDRAERRDRGHDQ